MSWDVEREGWYDNDWDGGARYEAGENDINISSMALAFLDVDPRENITTDCTMNEEA